MSACSRPPRIVSGSASPWASSMRAPMARSGSVTRRIGRRRSEASPVSVAANRCPARMPSMRRAIVPELPQCSRETGDVRRETWTLTVAPSRMVEISAPRPRSTRAVLFTSSPVRSPVSSLVPRASAASMRARWEILLSPGGRTAPRTFTRRVSGATRRRGAARRRAPRRRPPPAPARAPPAAPRESGEQGAVRRGS